MTNATERSEFASNLVDACRQQGGEAIRVRNVNRADQPLIVWAIDNRSTTVARETRMSGGTAAEVHRSDFDTLERVVRGEWGENWFRCELGHAADIEFDPAGLFARLAALQDKHYWAADQIRRRARRGLDNMAEPILKLRRLQREGSEEAAHYLARQIACKYYRLLLELNPGCSVYAEDGIVDFDVVNGLPARPPLCNELLLALSGLEDCGPAVAAETIARARESLAQVRALTAR